MRCVWIAPLLLVACGGGLKEKKKKNPDQAERAAPAAVAVQPPPSTTYQVRGNYSAFDPFASSADVQALASAARGRGGGAVESIAGVVRASIKAGRGRILDPGLTSHLPPRSPGELAQLLKARQAGDVRSGELAFLVVTAARKAGVAAGLAEAYTLDSIRLADQSGSGGYLVAAVFPDAIGQGDPLFLDPSGARIKEARWLDDQAARALFLMLHAKGLLATNPEEREKAFDMTAAALALAKDSSPLLSALESELTLATQRPASEFLAAAERAVKLRDDPPRRFVLARARAAAMDEVGAQKELQKALETSHVVPALVMRGQRAMAMGDPGTAKLALAAARSANPAAPGVHLLAAQLAALEGRRPDVDKELKGALDADPHDLQLRLSAYIILRRVGNQAAANKLRADTERLARVPDAAKKLFAGVAGGP